jgi:hypothetical protein
MKFSIMLFACIITLSAITNLNAQVRNQTHYSVVAVKIMDIWIEGRIIQLSEDRIIFRLGFEESEKFQTSQLVAVNKKSINTVRVRTRPSATNEANSSTFEEISPSILESRGKNRINRKRLTATGIGLIASGLLSFVIAQGDLDSNQFKTVQTVMGATLGLSGIAALAVGELETEDYPQLELALLLYKQSIE